MIDDWRVFYIIYNTYIICFLTLKHVKIILKIDLKKQQSKDLEKSKINKNFINYFWIKVLL